MKEIKTGIAKTIITLFAITLGVFLGKIILHIIPAYIALILCVGVLLFINTRK